MYGAGKKQRMLLKDKVALIAGTGCGIGRAIALAFAGEGALIAVTGRNTRLLTRVVDEIRAGSGMAEALALDVTQADDADRVAKQLIGIWGQIDVLVNNAGVITDHTPVWATTIDQWDEVVMNTNLRGMFLVCGAVIPHMMEREEGVIINIGSSSGRLPEGDYGAYATSKWDVGLSASLAHSLRPHGVRVNGINPDWVDSGMARAYDPRGNHEWITGEQIAQSALYLAVHAPRVMTGQFIDIFGV